MIYVAITALIVFGLLAGLRMVHATDERRLKIERDAEVSRTEAQATKTLFEAEERKSLKQAENLGMIEAEIARKQRVEIEYKIEQTRLAHSVIEAFGTKVGDDLMRGHHLEVGGLLEAVRRQLEGLPPSQPAIQAANARTKKKEEVA